MAVAEPVVCPTCELHAEAVFRVEGMDCHEEVVILERRLKPLTGLEALSADLIGQRLHVKYDAAKLTTSAIVDAVGQTGMRMWLEHEEPTASGADVAWRWRLLLACGAAVGVGLALSAAGRPAAAAAALTAAAFVGGIFPVRRAVSAVRSRTLDINTLMVVAVAGALVLGEWLEAASVVFLFAVAQWLEVRTLERARQAIRAMLDLSPREAIVRHDGHEHRVPVEEVHVGDDILVRPGDKVPLDGVVVAGHSDVNEAPLTGESLPVDKGAGDQVYAGTINGHGALEIRVTRVGRDTRLARIIYLVEAAQASRAPVQTFVDRFARIYTPAVIGLALIVALAPALAGADTATWVYRALVLLVISCPCALVISTPVSIVSALSAAARNGVLVKGGAHLERLAAIRAIAFDKTGTLTKGELHVTDVVSLGTLPATELMRYAAAVESRSAHPVARAVVDHARSLGVDLRPVSRFASVPGMGAEAQVDGVHVTLGNAHLFASRGVALPGGRMELEHLMEQGKSLVYVSFDGTIAGVIALADRPRQTALEAIELLREQGVRWVAMLTGDHAATARRVAEALSLDEHHAELLPEQKHAFVRSLRERHGALLMVGDGINDAPALAAADVGVAMGAAGSDVALETADVALMSDELLKLPYAIRLARATLRNVRTNVAISLALKAAFLVMAVTGSATLWMAVLADTGASVIVVGNALRLLRAR
ncbi:MAG: cadmium-translocating P-type ATPase [Acidobacteria bacterium]|nr:cadmium-translocating P-type ATPase [Acidobacteriota bacterium]